MPAENVHDGDEDDSVWNPSQRERETALLFVYEQLSDAITRFSERIPTVQTAEDAAWVARCLLDLEIWVDHCNDSSERAQQFWQDYVRDLNELVRDLKTPIECEVTARYLLLAQGLLTGSKKGDNPTYNATAAKEIDRQEYRKIESAPLSKFVHPTALSMFTMSDMGNLKNRLREGFVAQAEKYALNARTRLSSGLLAEAHSKFGPIADRLRKPSSRLED